MNPLFGGAAAALAALTMSASAARADPTGSVGFSVSGTVSYLDSSGNATTNISNIAQLDLTQAIITVTSVGSDPGDIFANALNPGNSNPAVGDGLLATSMFTVGASGFRIVDDSYCANGANACTTRYGYTLLGQFNSFGNAVDFGTSGSGLNITHSFAINGSIATGQDYTGTLTSTITLSVTQTGGPTSALSVSGTQSTPAVALAVPEPASAALLGVGLLGVGFIVRRKVG